MSILLSGLYRSTRGVAYLVEIHDNELDADSKDEFVITQRPSYRRTGATRSIYQTISGMAYTINMRVESGNPAEAFVNSFVLETNENRYWIRVYRNEQEHYRGFLQIDQSRVPIRSQEHYSFELLSTDRLAQSSNYDYHNPEDIENPLRGADSVSDHIRQCIRSLGFIGLYDDTETLLRVSISYHNNQMPNTTDDYGKRILIDHKIFASELEEGFQQVPGRFAPIFALQPVEPGNTRDTLEALTFQFNAFLFQSGGVFYFLSRDKLLTGGQITYHNYTRDGSYTGTTKETSEMTVGSLTVNNTGSYMLTGGTYRFLPPIKDLIIDHNRGGGNNKITGSLWQVSNHEEQCFEYINNEGSATLIGRFVLGVAISGVNNNNTDWFRMAFGITIKIGSYYLRRDYLIDDLDFGPFSNRSPGRGHDWTLGELPEAYWSIDPGPYMFMLDWMSDNRIIPSADDITIIDIESPPIPESGELCVNVEILHMTRRDGFTIFGDKVWDPVTFLDTTGTAIPRIERGGDIYRFFWQASDNHLEIESNVGEENEDTLSFNRYTAQVNLNNSERLEFQTDIGDEPRANTHGRLQIDKSAALDGSDIVDADGGWTLNGVGTEYDHQVALLAWDMARLRVGVVRMMTATIKSNLISCEPQTRVTFDGAVSIMGQVQVSTENEEYRGTWYSIDDSGSDQIELIIKNFAKATSSNPNTIIVPSDTPSNTPQEPYVYDISGIDQSFINIPPARPLPDPGVFSETEINALFIKAMRGTANMRYKQTPTSTAHFGIDIENNRILLFRDARPTDEYFFQWRTET